ncbi:MAG TPA: Rieske 2Fe-2S domain-containing protein [Sphingomonadaceae bacterium]|uniref:Rieske (2Fe-2S) protein n=1 Tax=Caenibius fulvus TaxID=2126012 RepID=UPI002D4A0E1A|nr:Rieske 2Fe-2S domain-containing protein [Sphingomonadaceae bacterium]
MSDWVAAAPLDQLQRKKKLVVQVNGEDVLVYLFEGEVYAMADLCVHKHKRLSKGLIFQGKMICPGHQWAFDLKTGWEQQWSRCQPVYDTRVVDGTVEIFPVPRIIDSNPEGCAVQVG